ncbi:hypothetical protein MASR1M32_35070 [Rhodobacter sp.]
MKRLFRPLSLSIAALLLTSAASAEDLRIFGWANEMPDEVLEDFTAATGIEVIFDTFDSNEAMIAKLEAGARAMIWSIRRNTPYRSCGTAGWWTSWTTRRSRPMTTSVRPSRMCPMTRAT